MHSRRALCQADIDTILDSLFPYLAAQDGSGDTPPVQYGNAVRESGRKLRPNESLAAYATWRNYLTARPESWRRYVAEQKRRSDIRPGGKPPLFL